MNKQWRHRICNLPWLIPPQPVFKSKWRALITAAITWGLFKWDSPLPLPAYSPVRINPLFINQQPSNTTALSPPPLQNTSKHYTLIHTRDNKCYAKQYPVIIYVQFLWQWNWQLQGIYFLSWPFRSLHPRSPKISSFAWYKVRVKQLSN